MILERNGGVKFSQILLFCMLYMPCIVFNLFVRLCRWPGRGGHKNSTLFSGWLSDHPTSPGRRPAAGVGLEEWPVALFLRQWLWLNRYVGCVCDIRPTVDSEGLITAVPEIPRSPPVGDGCAAALLD
jgi:hypothetical protein